MVLLRLDCHIANLSASFEIFLSHQAVYYYLLDNPVSGPSFVPTVIAALHPSNRLWAPVFPDPLWRSQAASVDGKDLTGLPTCCGSRWSLPVESPHAHRILCSFADAMAHSCLEWSAAHSLLHLLPELSWFLDDSYDKFNIHHLSSLWSCCLPILGNQCAFLYCLLPLSNYLSSVLYNLCQCNGCN